MNDARYQLVERGYGTHQALLDLIRDRGRLLDVGAAGGYISAIARDTKDVRPVAVDISASSCETCRERGLTTIEGDVVDLIRDGALEDHAPFDQVLFADVLEHIYDPSTVLVAVRQLLAPGGSIIVSLPNIAYLLARLRLLAGVWRYTDTGIFDRTHVRFFTRATATEMLADAGFDVVREIPIGPAGYLVGRRGVPLTRLRPQVLASQLVFEAAPRETASLSAA